MKTISFIITQKNKIFSIQFNKRVQNPYSENYKLLLKVTKENLDNWEDIQCSLIGRLDIIEMVMFPKLIYSFNVIAIKI